MEGDHGGAVRIPPRRLVRQDTTIHDVQQIGSGPLHRRRQRFDHLEIGPDSLPPPVHIEDFHVQTDLPQAVDL